MDYNKRKRCATEVAILVIFWLLLVYLGVAITASNDVPDDHFIRDVAGYAFLYKYILALGFAILTAVVGAIARCWALKNQYGYSLKNERSLIGDVAKTGVLVGGLTLATLAAVVATMQQIVIDGTFLVPSSDRLTEIAYLAIALVSFIIFAAYPAGRDQILKKPERHKSESTQLDH